MKPRFTTGIVPGRGGCHNVTDLGGLIVSCHRCVIVAAIALAAGMTTTTQAAQEAQPPRLVLQITVDALRGDLPGRNAHLFGDGGFRYLMDELGIENAHYFDTDALDTAPAIAALKQRFGLGEELIEAYNHPYVYLNRDLIRAQGLEQAEVERAVLDNGLIWRKRALFQTTQGNETAFLFEPDGSVTRGRDARRIIRKGPLPVG